MTNQYIALLRGINVGGKNLLPMKSLVSMLTEAGCSDVQTYIQSGNAVFDWRGKQRKVLVQELQSRILAGHGFSPEVLILTSTELQRAVENNPYVTSDGKALHFFFLTSSPRSPDLVGLAALKSETEQFALIENVFYLHAPDGVARSKLAAGVGKHVKVSTTARNWNTVRRLEAMLNA